MIRQRFVIPAPPTLPLPKVRGGRKQVAAAEQKVTHIWEIRHAGLLGIKYEVAVRNDLFDSGLEQEQIKQEDGGSEVTGITILSDVVESAVLGCVFHGYLGGSSYLMHLSSLGDKDDDVRAVAASCLLPVAGHLVEQLPESLDRVLLVLWSCLSDMKDDLSSSVGAVMELLGECCGCCYVRDCLHCLSGKLVAYNKVIDILANESVSYVCFIPCVVMISDQYTQITPHHSRTNTISFLPTYYC